MFLVSVLLYAEMFHCVFGPLLVHLCAFCVPVQLYELWWWWWSFGR